MYRKPGMSELRDLLKPGGLDTLLSKVTKQPDLQAQLQNQLQSMRLTMEKLSPEAISAALRAALGSETSLPRIRNPPPNDLKPLLHKLLSLMEDPSDEGTAGMHQVKRALADLARSSSRIGALAAELALDPAGSGVHLVPTRLIARGSGEIPAGR